MKIYYRQHKEWTCGPAVMRTALASLGIKKSEREFVKLMHTTRRYGTSHNQFSKVANKLNLTFITKKGSSVKELKNRLREKYKIIICYYIKREKTGHYAIVKNINNKIITLIDPYYGQNKKYSLLYFRKIWHGVRTPKGWYIGIKK